MKSPTKQGIDVQQTAISKESTVDIQPINSAGAVTPKKHSGLMPNWEKGKSGNPNGRPKGARSRLSETFLADLAEHWQANGKTALQAAYEKNPVEYVRVVASLLPKNVAVDVDVKFERIERVIVDDVRVIEHTTSSVEPIAELTSDTDT